MNDELVAQEQEENAVVGPLFPEGTARLNITWQGQNGDVSEPIPYDADDALVKTLAKEAVGGGSVLGINADLEADFADFVVDRFPPTDEIQYHRLMLRSKTPFGV